MLSRIYLPVFLIGLLSCCEDISAQVGLARGPSSNAVTHSWETEAYKSIYESQYQFNVTGHDKYSAINEKNSLGFVANHSGYQVKKILTSPNSKDFTLQFDIRSIQGRSAKNFSKSPSFYPGKLVFADQQMAID